MVKIVPINCANSKIESEALDGSEPCYTQVQPSSAERKSVVFSCYLKDAGESTKRRLGLSKFQSDGTDTEKALDPKLELTAGLKNWLPEEDLSCLVYRMMTKFTLAHTTPLIASIGSTAASASSTRSTNPLYQTFDNTMTWLWSDLRLSHQLIWSFI